LFNEGHSNPDLENKFCYKNVATWWSKKRTRLKTSLQEVKTLVLFRNEGRMHWVTYIIFQDLKIIEEFNSMGSSDTNILKGLYRWLFIEYQRIGIHLDSKKWQLYQTRWSTPRQRNGYDCGFFFILVALHAGLCLDLNNISQEHVTRARCQMLLHLLQISRADDNDDDVLVNLADDLDDDGEASAHIDGMSEDDNVEEVDANAAQNDDVDDDNSNAAQENMDDEGDANAGEDNDGQDDNVNEGPGEGAGNNNDDQDEHHHDQGANNGNEDDSSDEADDESDDDDDEDVDNEDANQLIFASVPEQYPISPLFTGLMADMSCPASSVVLPPSSPVGPFVTQDATFTSSVTSPVVAILSPLFGAETALSIERELREADQREADQRRVNRLYPLQEEPPPANVPSQSTSSELLLMPNLNHDENIDDKVD
jgi:hypothetical protein